MNAPEPSILEKSLADALAAINGAETLSGNTRSQWACALRSVAAALDRPPSLIPARWTAIRIPLRRLHHAPLGISAKTLANYKSNAKAALRWYSDAEHVPRWCAPLLPAWKHLWSALPSKRCKIRLYGLFHFASAKGVMPEEVTEDVVNAYFTYREQTTYLDVDSAARRTLARAWNGCAAVVSGWPQVRLIEAATLSNRGVPDWMEFPERLRSEVAVYLESLTQIRRNHAGRRLRPCKASTIETRRIELVAFARKAVKIGIPIDELSSLSALLHPDIVDRVIDAYWQGNGDTPKTYTIELAWKLVSIARAVGCLSEVDVQRLDDIRFNLASHTRGGLTDKNLHLIRQVLVPGIWGRVLHLPDQLMAEADRLSEQAPFKAALRAQLATAIAILTFAPVRLGNLVSIQLDENLIRPGGPDAPYLLLFPDYDVKNRVQLEFPFDQRVTDLIASYAHIYRPTLLRGTNSRALFPGLGGTTKSKGEFGRQIVRCVDKATGLRITVHQWRHAAAAIILKHQPGNYELVRRILGHRSVATTINFYIGLETTEANRQFGEIVRQNLFTSPETASPPR